MHWGAQHLLLYGVKGNFRRGFAASRLLGSRVRMPPVAGMSVCCECCVLSDTGLCVGLIVHAEESCRQVRRCVWYRNLKNEKVMTRVGQHCHRSEGRNWVLWSFSGYAILFFWQRHAGIKVGIWTVKNVMWETLNLGKCNKGRNPKIRP
jgi:hypothetical protein